MHHKKIIALGSVLTLLVFVSPPASAQGAPVIDVDHILETIHNGYMMYQSLQNAIQNLEYAYETTQAQLQQLQQMDVSDIRSFTDAVSYVNKEVDFVRRTENRFKAISVTVGGKRVPLSEFYRLPGEATDMIAHDMTADMSDWERARAWSYYGLDPANYMYLKAWNGRLNEAAKQMTSIGDELAAQNQESNEEIGKIMEKSRDAKSDLSVLQGITALLQILIGDQKEANRLNALRARYEADKDMAADLPVKPRGKFSDDWIE